MLTAVSHILSQIKIQLQKGHVFLKNAFCFASESLFRLRTRHQFGTLLIIACSPFHCKAFCQSELSCSHQVHLL